MYQLFYILVFALLHFSTQSPPEGKENKLTIHLFHRDLPSSPFYNRSRTFSELILDHSLRSLSRVNSFSSYMSMNEKYGASTLLTHNSGNYLMKISVGSPPSELWLMVNFASDLTWTQCVPCDQQDAPFNPIISSTYEKMLYDTELCRDLGNARINHMGECHYNHSYGGGGGGSYTSGILSNDIFYLDNDDDGETLSNKLVFGCSDNNQGLFNSRAHGIVAFGGGLLSFSSQLKAYFDNKFSYCLLPMTTTSTSKFKLGHEAVIYRNTVTTPLKDKLPKTFYYLTLESVSIGDEETSTSFQTDIVIDSGTSFTFLAGRLYNNLEGIVRGILGEPILNPPKTFKLCYKKDSIYGTDFSPVGFHFRNASIFLQVINTFVLYNKTLYCMSILPHERFSVFGSMAQANFQVAFDLHKKHVSFTPMDCTRF